MDLNFVYVTCLSGWKHLINLDTISYVTKYDNYNQIIFTNGLKIETNADIQKIIDNYR